jgi:uncharacterized membrane protein YbhN (UPF0104 family)
VTTPPDNATPRDKDQAGRRRPWLTGFVGTVIGIAGLGFAVFALARSWDEISAADFVPRILAMAGAVGIVGMTTIGLNWIRIMRATGGSVRVRHGLHWYFVGQLGKYIPGGLWAVLGRGELATRGGVERAIGYPSVGISLVTTYAAAATTGAIFIAFGTATMTARISWIGLSAATVTAVTLGLSGPVVRQVNTFVSRFGIRAELPSTSPRMSLSAIALTMPAWLAIGGATALVGSALGFAVTPSQVIAATSYSWLAGFLVIPVPGGLGVREAAFIALYPGSTEEAAAIAVSARIVFVLADLTGAALSTLASRLDRAQEPS